MNKHLLAKSLAVFLLAGMFPIGIVSLRADTVKLKSGEVFEGKITFETSDVVKIQVPISASINETKTILRSDIAEIVKAAPDDVAMEELKGLIPTPSLMKASDYQTLIESKVQSFLNSFPDSKHKPEVEKILEQLKKEKDMVERGQIKLENDWIDVQTQQEFKTRTDARILNLLMRQDAAQKNLLGALRRFEILEEQYYGAPAHVEAVPEVLKILPAYGQTLTRALQNADYHNKKWMEDKMLLDEVERGRVEAARQREIDLYQRNVDAEKAKGIKWQSVNPLSKEDLQANVNQVSAEIKRLQALDLASLTEQSKKLVEADESIAKGDLAKAKTLIAEAGVSIKKSGRTSKSSSKKGGAPSSTYAKALADKIAAKEEAIAAAEAARKSNKKGQQAAGLLNTGASAAAAGSNPGEEPAAGEPAAEEQPESGARSAMEEMMATNKKSAEETKVAEEGKPEKTTTAKAKSKPKPKPKASSSLDDDEDEVNPREQPRPSSEGGGGFGLPSFQTILMIVAGLMVAVTVAMKVLGIGSKKE